MGNPRSKVPLRTGQKDRPNSTLQLINYNLFYFWKFRNTVKGLTLDTYFKTSFFTLLITKYQFLCISEDVTS